MKTVEVLIVIAITIIFIVEIVSCVLLLLKIKRFKRLTLKDTIIYPFIILATFFTLLIANVHFLDIKGYTAITESFKDGISIVALSINKDVISGLMHGNLRCKYLLLTYFVEYGISAIALFSISISVLFVTCWNLFKRLLAFLNPNNEEVDYILGFNEDAKEFIKANYFDILKQKSNKIDIINENNYRYVAVLDSSVLKSYEDEKFFLHKFRTSFRALPYGLQADMKKTIAKLAFGKRAKRIITFFDDDMQSYHFLNQAIEYVKLKKNKDIKIYMVASTSQFGYLQNIVNNDNSQNTDEDTKKVFGKFIILNKHDLIAWDFTRNHNFAKYFPKDYVNEDLTIGDCDINLYMFGFGKVNQVLLREILIQNQFVSKIKTENNKWKMVPKRINVKAYESNRKIESLDLFNGILKYNKSIYDNPSKYVELPEDYASYVELKGDSSIYETNFLKDLYKEIENKAKKRMQVNYFIVSLDSDFVNSNVGRKLKNNFENINNTHNTFFVRLSEDQYDNDHNLVSFGLYNDILSHGNVIGDHLYSTANLYKKIYDGNQMRREPTPIEEKSNFYAVVGIYFKLTLLLLKRDNATPISLDALREVMKKYKYNPDEDIKDYNIGNIKKGDFYNDLCDGSDSEILKIRDVFAFIEHERWNAYQMSIGVLPLSIEKCENIFKQICDKFDSNKQDELNPILCEKKDKDRYKIKFNKTVDEAYHLCLTSQSGLKEIYYFIAKLYLSKFKDNKNVTTSIDFIAYDYRFLDIIKDDFNANTNNENLKMKEVYKELIEFLTNKN